MTSRYVAPQVISSVVPAEAVLTLRAAANQTANIQQWQNSAGTVLTSVSSAGVITNTIPTAANGAKQNTLAMNIGADGTLGPLSFVLGGFPSATGTSRYAYIEAGDNIDWRNLIFFPQAGGSSARIGIHQTSPAAKLHILNWPSTLVGLIVQGASSQTGDLQQWQNSAGTVLSRIDNNGYLSIAGTLTSGIYFQVAGSAAFGASGASSNTVTAIGAGDATMSYIEAFAGNNNNTKRNLLLIPYGGRLGIGNGVTSSPSSRVQIVTGSDSLVGFIIQGATSQTANLQEWQDSAGTVLSSVSALGAFLAPAATTSTPSIRLPHGTAPTSPTNGDVWTTSAGIYVRIDGTTVGPLGTGGGGGGAAGDSDQTILPVQIFS